MRGFNTHHVPTQAARVRASAVGSWILRDVGARGHGSWAKTDNHAVLSSATRFPESLGYSKKCMRLFRARVTGNEL